MSTTISTSSPPSLSQISSLSGKKYKYPYYDWVLSQLAEARAGAQQQIENDQYEAELAQEQAQFDATQALAKETADASSKQAQTSTAIGGAGLALAAGNALKDTELGKTAGTALKTVAEKIYSPKTTTPTTSPSPGGEVPATTAPAPGETPPVSATPAASTEVTAADTGSMMTTEPSGVTTYGPKISGQASYDAGVSNVGAEAGGAAAEAGGAAAEGGATLGSIGSGVVSALPWIAAWKLGMPILTDIMEQGTSDLVGADKDSSNVLAQANRIAGSSKGVVEPAYEEITGDELPEVVQALSNPAGYLAGKAGCIIITACTTPDSYEVNIARIYRDAHMSPEQLRGYYMMAEKIVPYMHKYPRLKRFIKTNLVDHWVKYGRWYCGMGRAFPPTKTRNITRSFLSLCGLVGRMKHQYVRINGEVF
jgi:hypothetical protein